MILALLSLSSILASPKYYRNYARFLGDKYYAQKDYPLAQIEYERSLEYSKNPKNLKTKLALTLARQDKWEESLNILDNAYEDFQELYVGMYVAFRLNNLKDAINRQVRILKYTKSTKEQKNKATLLGGSIFIEEDQLKEGEALFQKLLKTSKDIELKQISSRVLTSILEYKKQDKKKPWLAGTLSGILPGSGQWYSAHYADALISFFFNFSFLFSAITIYNLENEAGRPHQASIVMGLIGVNFYVANLVGAVKSAERYNNFQTRTFHQKLRDEYYNLDYIEKSSGVNFSKL